MNPISSFMMGKHLTKLTDIFELIEKSKQISYIGAGGIDAFEPSIQNKFIHEIELRLEKLKKYPPYEITKTLLANFEINQVLNGDNELRINAIENLYKALVAEKMALEMDNFEKAFGTH